MLFRSHSRRVAGVRRGLWIDRGPADAPAVRRIRGHGGTVTSPPPRRSVRVIGITLMIAVSTGLSLAVADVVLDQYQARSEPPFYTNLTPAELSTRPVKTRGAVDGRYQDDIVDLPFHEPHRAWIWAGQRDRRIEFLVKGRWNNIGCQDRKSTRLNSSH